LYGGTLFRVVDSKEKGSCEHEPFSFVAEAGLEPTSAFRRICTRLHAFDFTPNKSAPGSSFQGLFAAHRLRFGGKCFGKNYFPWAIFNRKTFCAEFIMRQKSLFQIGSVSNVDFVVLRRIKNVNREHQKERASID
jgi:hypothetical protein